MNMRNWIAALLAGGLIATSSLAVRAEDGDNKDDSRKAKSEERNEKKDDGKEEKRDKKQDEKRDEKKSRDDDSKSDDHGDAKSRDRDERSNANRSNRDDLPTQDGPAGREEGGRRDGAPTREPRRLGVLLGPSTTTGALVHQVAPQSAAARAGLRPGDYIVTVDDETVHAPQDVGRILDRAEAGDEMRLSIWNNGRTRTLQVRFGERGDDIEVVGERRNGDSSSRNDLPQENIQRASGDRFDDSQPSSSANNGRQSQPWLGIAPADAGASFGQGSEGNQERRGVMVRSVFPGSPAEQAGVRNGDMITKFDGKDVSRAQAILDAMRDLDPQDKIEIELSRNGESRTVNVTLTDRNQFFSQNGRQAGAGFSNDPNAGFNQGGQFNQPGQFSQGGQRGPLNQNTFRNPQAFPQGGQPQQQNGRPIAPQSRQQDASPAAPPAPAPRN